jgi:hypothetical protein
VKHDCRMSRSASKQFASLNSSLNSVSQALPPSDSWFPEALILSHLVCDRVEYIGSNIMTLHGMNLRDYLALNDESTMMYAAALCQ